MSRVILTAEMLDAIDYALARIERNNPDAAGEPVEDAATVRRRYLDCCAARRWVEDEMRRRHLLSLKRSGNPGAR